MNEERKKKQLYFAGNPTDQLQKDWDGLMSLLDSAEQTATVAGRKDLVPYILRQKVALKNNKPSKKLYRAILNRIKEIEDLLSKSQQNQHVK